MYPKLQNLTIAMPRSNVSITLNIETLNIIQYPFYTPRKKLPVNINLLNICNIVIRDVTYNLRVISKTARTCCLIGSTMDKIELDLPTTAQVTVTDNLNPTIY